MIDKFATKYILNFCIQINDLMFLGKEKLDLRPPLEPRQFEAVVLPNMGCI